MSTWWERKLSPQPNQQRPAPTNYPPTPAPAPAPSRVAPLPQSNQPQVTPENFAEASTQWAGGEATARETSNCPNCGSSLFFSRDNAGGLRSQSGMSVAPAARCYECGYTDGRDLQGAPPA